MNAYIGSFLLSQLQLLLSILKGFRVFVQLILSCLQLLLQGDQVILELQEEHVCQYTWRETRTAASCVYNHALFVQLTSRTPCRPIKQMVYCSSKTSEIKKS